MEQSATKTGGLLTRGEIFPDFTLPDAAGSNVSSRSFYMRSNFVVVLLANQIDEKLEEWFAELVRVSSTVAPQDGKFFVLAGDQDSAHPLIDPENHPDALSLLVDHDGKVRDKFGHWREETALIIADRYGKVFFAASGSPDDRELDPTEIPDWIELIACRCS